MGVYQKFHGSTITSAVQFIDLRPLPSNYKQRDQKQLIPPGKNPTRGTPPEAALHLGNRIDVKVRALGPPVLAPPVVAPPVVAPPLPSYAPVACDDPPGLFRMVTPTPFTSTCYNHQAPPVVVPPTAQLDDPPMIIDQPRAPIHDLVDDEDADLDDPHYALRRANDQGELDTPCDLDYDDYRYVMIALL